MRSASWLAAPRELRNGGIDKCRQLRGREVRFAQCDYCPSPARSGLLLSTGLNSDGQLGRSAGESSLNWLEVALPGSLPVIAVAGGASHSRSARGWPE
ncbi:MAG: hypothetical protein IPJ14_15170 [Kineosporiaceae bacterium]|nr:hypothetical protein [Kineosporiaceae bacterium]